jgi:plasmid stabilization system protein ParE
MRYRISRRADTDIERICDHVAADNPDAADRLDEQLHRAIQLLARFRGLGHTRPDVSDPRYRFRAVGNYVIAYRVEQNELVVIRVVHGARDFRKLFPPKP